MDAIEIRTDPDVRLQDAELRLRVAWLAAMAGGPAERQALVEAARQCGLARAAVRARYRVFHPSTRT